MFQLGGIAGSLLMLGRKASHRLPLITTIPTILSQSRFSAVPLRAGLTLTEATSQFVAHSMKSRPWAYVGHIPKVTLGLSVRDDCH